MLGERHPNLALAALMLGAAGAACVLLAPGSEALLVTTPEYIARDNMGAQGPTNVWASYDIVGARTTGWTCPSAVNQYLGVGSSIQPLLQHFEYYGTPISNLQVTAEGFLSFNPITAITSYGGPIPSSAAPNGYAGPWFAGLDPNNGDRGRVCYKQMGAGTPDEAVAVIYDDVADRGRGPQAGGMDFHQDTPQALDSHVNALALLFTRGNAIEFHYGEATEDYPYGPAPWIGIEDGGGTRGVLYAGTRNGTGVITTNHSVQFRPTSSFPFAFSDGDFDGNGVVDDPAYVLSRLTTASDELAVNSTAGLLANDHAIGNVAAQSCRLGTPFTSCSGLMNIPTLAGGNVTLRVDGSFKYTTPSHTFCGTDSFAYHLDDAFPDDATAAYTDRANVTVLVKCSAGVLATDDTFSSLSVPAPGVLANDVDLAPGPHNLTVRQIGSPAPSGTVLVLRPDGSFDLTAPALACGDATFDYELTDGVDVDQGRVTVPLGCSALPDPAIRWVQSFWFAPLPIFAGSPAFKTPNPFATATLIASSSGAPGYVRVVDGAGRQLLHAGIIAGGSARYELPYLNPAAGTYANAAYRVDVTDGVVAAYFYPIEASKLVSDAGNLLPDNMLGNDYWTFGTESADDFLAIIATENGTKAEITYPNGSRTSLMLNDFDEFVARGLIPGTGTHVHTDKPVAAFSGSSCTTIGNSACDHVSDQAHPSFLGGTTFAVCSTVPDRPASANGPGRGFDRIRILAVEGDANVTLDPPPSGYIDPSRPNVKAGPVTNATFRLARGGQAWFNTQHDTVITSTSKVLVAAYYGTDSRPRADGKPYDWSHPDPGDPSMVVLTPMERFGTHRTFFTPQDWSLELTVAQPRGSGAVLDGSRMLTGRPIGASSFECLHESLAPGTHQLESASSVSASIWATEWYSAFWYEAGGRLYNDVVWRFDASASCMDQAVRFFDAGSKVPQGAIIRVWSWDFGDGSTGAGYATSHRYQAGGRYHVRLTITDSDGTSYHSDQDVWSAKDTDCPLEIDPLPDLMLEVGRRVIVCPPAARDRDDPDLAWSTTGLPAGALLSEGCILWTTRVPDIGVHPGICFAVDNGHEARQSCFTITVYRFGQPPPNILDSDHDGIADLQDNCPDLANRDQGDDDQDGVGNACGRMGTAQRFRAGEGPDVDANDRDYDGISDPQDNCPAQPNPGQTDLDRDGFGDACDEDVDGDGIAQAGAAGAYLDNCPIVPNPDQADIDQDGRGDACGPAGLLQRRPTGPRSGVPVASTGASASTVAGGLLALCAAALLWWRRRWLLAAAMALFSRLGGQDLTLHPIRATLVQLVAANPGVHAMELVRLSGRGKSTVRHHLAILRKAGLVSEYVTGGFTCYYPHATGPQARHDAAIKSDLARQVETLVRALPGVSAADAARLLGVDYNLANYHMRRLGRLGALRLEDAPLRAFPA